MAAAAGNFVTGHRGALHDAQFDYYAKRLATCSSDRTIRVWDVGGPQPQFCAELVGHDGPVWQVAWAHPQFGSVLASAGYDRQIFVWRESAPYSNSWSIVYKNEDHCNSVNAVQFAACEAGLHVAAGSSDGTVSIMSHSPNHSWHRKAFNAHPNGVNAVSWSPAVYQTDFKSAPGGGGKLLAPRTMSLATGGCDHMVRIWHLAPSSNEWIELSTLGSSGTGHSAWVRDVAWRPNVGLPSSTIASGGDDQTVIIWSQENEGSSWEAAQTIRFEGRVWRLAWSVTGTVLAVAHGEGQVSLYTENLTGVWEKIGSPGGVDTTGLPPTMLPTEPLL